MNEVPPVNLRLPRGTCRYGGKGKGDRLQERATICGHRGRVEQVPFRAGCNAAARRYDAPLRTSLRYARALLHAQTVTVTNTQYFSDLNTPRSPLGRAIFTPHPAPP